MFLNLFALIFRIILDKIHGKCHVGGIFWGMKKWSAVKSHTFFGQILYDKSQLLAHHIQHLSYINIYINFLPSGNVNLLPSGNVNLLPSGNSKTIRCTSVWNTHVSQYQEAQLRKALEHHSSMIPGGLKPKVPTSVSLTDCRWKIFQSGCTPLSMNDGVQWMTRSNFATQSWRATLAVQPLHVMVRHCVAGLHAKVVRQSCSVSVLKVP